ncbi:MAG: class I SAM-dependent methyltransferase [Terracidiphilus sp.]
MKDQEHLSHQKRYMEDELACGPRSHTVAPDKMTTYILRWRIEEAIRRLFRADATLSHTCSVLVLCAAEGYEGTVLLDMGFTDVTVSDLSELAARTAERRDPRLKARVLNAEDTGLAAQSYDIVLVQDGLHHLQRPIQGFTEMLRVSSRAVIFLEPHVSLVAQLIGTKWETHGAAVNYVFRWTNRMVQDVASSYLGRGAFRNLSFSCCHHNIVFAKAGERLGGGPFAIACIRLAKAVMDFFFSRMGNQFCGLIVMEEDRTGKI